MSKYQSIKPDKYGIIPYSKADHHVWSILLKRQNELVIDRACDDFIDGVEKLGFTENEIPQHLEVTRRLKALTGWSVAAVEAVIPAHEFFTLLANKHFPAASFIRTFDEIDYLQEPDIFHELYGHCPLLTNQAYAQFMHDYGKLALEVKPIQRRILFRLFWFTIEFGLIKSPKGLRIFGGGILSSKGETLYALTEKSVVREDLNPINAMRTPFRIDIMQPKYFIITQLDQLYGLLSNRKNIIDIVDEAIELGDFPALFSPKLKPSNAEHC
jgi:phenylalanine-4-hydroxylase